MIKNIGDYAVRTAGAAIEKAQHTAANTLHKTGLPQGAAHTANALGVPEYAQQKVSSIFERLGLTIKSGTSSVPRLPQEILELISNNADKKTNAAFAAASHSFAQAAGSTVQSLTFYGPHDLHLSAEMLKQNESLIGFAAHGLKHLTLNADRSPEGEYDLHDLQQIPDWMRASLQQVTVKAPLTGEAWDFLQTFPNMKKIEMADMTGPVHNTVLDHLPAGQPELHLRMPLSPHEMAQLQRFNQLKTVHVSVVPGKSLAEVLEPFTAPESGDEDAPETASVLHNAAIATLDFTVDRSGNHQQTHSHFQENDVDLLPESLKSLKLHGISPSIATLEQLKETKLTSLTLDEATLLSGDLLKHVLDHPTLTEFHAANAGLNAADAKTIAASPRLSAVYLPSNNRIGDEGLRALTANPRITHLDIARCGGSDRLLHNLAFNKPEHIQHINFDI
ncbi:hypothetical protein [Erwinia sp. 9145]|uniref:hypothetical protein n=1 Tax=Erwinia sp. 9145 TaxID=1500895 RepID=UPI00054F96D4|nr:hypothetical protein [Erwinia sp. 9145]